MNLPSKYAFFLFTSTDVIIDFLIVFVRAVFVALKSEEPALFL